MTSERRPTHHGIVKGSTSAVPAECWDALHAKPEFSPRFPQDSVVRWAFKTYRNRSGTLLKMIDVGAGSGRHAMFLAQVGYSVTATDYSQIAMANARRRAEEEGLALEVVQCGADNLPYSDNSFAGLLCYGVLCYMDPKEVKKAVGEFHRVLEPDGCAFVVTRTVEDSRYLTSGVRSSNTATVGGDGDVPWQVEVGMSMTFLSRDDVKEHFSDFSSVEIERMIFTQVNEKYRNDDWLITARK